MGGEPLIDLDYAETENFIADGGRNAMYMADARPMIFDGLKKRQIRKLTKLGQALRPTRARSRPWIPTERRQLSVGVWLRGTSYTLARRILHRYAKIPANRSAAGGQPSDAQWASAAE